MKILGTLTVDTADALDKVTDFNADLLDGKSSSLFLSRNSGTTGTDVRFAQRNNDTTITNADLQLQLANGNDFALFTALSTATTYATTTNSLTVKSTGLIGIGRANPLAKLHLHLTTAEQGDALSPFVISNSTDTALFQVDHNGKVSIGKSTISESPTNLLCLYLANEASSGGITVKNTYTPSSGTLTMDVVTLNMNGSSDGNNASLYTNKKLYIKSDNGTIFRNGTGAIFNIDSSGLVGINGLADTGSQLVVGGTTTTTGVTRIGIKSALTYTSTTGDAITSVRAIQAAITIGVNNTSVNAVYGLYIEAATVTAGTVISKYGIYQAGANDTNYFGGDVKLAKTIGVGGASPNAIYGLSIGAISGGVNLYGITDQEGTYTLSGAGTEVIPYRAYSNLVLGAHTLTNWYGFNSTLASKTGGTLTNAYAFYANSPSLATNNFAFYSNGGAKSVFGGNVGIGVTPSTWNQGKVLEIGNSGNALWGNSTANLYLTENTYYDGAWKYASSFGAATYQMLQGKHIWSSAASGTMGNTITFTQAMTLASDGNLAVGTTSTAGARLTVNTNETKGQNASVAIFGTSTSVNDFQLSFYREANNFYSIQVVEQSVGYKTLVLQPSGGNVLINTTTDNGVGKLQVNGGVAVTGAISTTTGANFATTSGNVGIGTSSPASRLTVNGVTTFVDGGDARVGTIRFAGGAFQIISSATEVVIDAPSSYIALRTGAAGTATERMRIASSGNVLIGTTTDDGVNKLQVNGGIAANGLTITGANALRGSYGGGGVGTNFAAGDGALQNNTTGGNNTASGVNALHDNNAGSNNTASGVNALYDITEGNNNTAFGCNTGRGIVTGSGNTIIGSNVTGLASGLTNNIIIADGAGNRRINVGSTGNVLIGTATDDGVSKLQVNGSVVANGIVGAKNPLAHHQTAIGVLQYTSNVTSIRSYGATSGTGAISFNTGGGGGSADTERVRIDSSGNVGIGTTTPTEKLDVIGNAKVSGTLSVGGAITAANISSSYLWVFTAADGVLSYATNATLTASNYIQPRSGDGVGTSLTTAPNVYNKNVCVYRSTTVYTTPGSITAYEQVFPDVAISIGGVCTIGFLASQNGYVFRVIFS